MWCHICDTDYPDFEDFRIHLSEVHGDSDLYIDNSESDEYELENGEEASEDNEDENIVLNSSPRKYDADHENISDDSVTALNTFAGELYDSDSSISEEDKSNQSIAEDKSDQSMAEEDKSDQSIAEENESDLEQPDLNLYPEECPDDDEEDDIDKKPVLNVSKRKLRQCNKNAKKSPVKPNVPKKSPKKCITSILKKPVQKKKKVAFSKKVLPKRKKSIVSYQEDTPKNSDTNNIDHSESSSDGDNHPVNSQPIPQHYFNSQPTPINNFVNSQSISNNNPVFLVNPYAGQGVNNYLMGNQTVQQPLYVVNPMITKPTVVPDGKTFDFTSRYIIDWLTKHKELCKNIEYPLSPSLFKAVKLVHRGIFDKYCTVSHCAESTVVLKVYEELDCMIHKHINSINNSLSVL